MNGQRKVFCMRSRTDVCMAVCGGQTGEHRTMLFEWRWSSNTTTVNADPLPFALLFLVLENSLVMWDTERQKTINNISRK